MVSLEQLKEKHIELWSWLVDNPLCGKNDWPEWNKLDYSVYGEAIDNGCFACQADTLLTNNEGVHGDCTYCPCSSLWGDDCCVKGCPYMEWLHSRNLEYKTRLANEIKNGWK